MKAMVNGAVVIAILCVAFACMVSMSDAHEKKMSAVDYRVEN